MTSEEIKRRRKALGMTQAEFAEAMGYKTAQTISNLESGRNDVENPKQFSMALAYLEMTTKPKRKLNAKQIREEQMKRWRGDK